MANKKFSEMDPTVSVTGGESVPILQGGVNKITTPVQIKSYIAAEPAANKVTSISGASTNVQFPSAKLLYDQLLLKQAVLNGNGFIKAAGTDITYDPSTYLTSLDGAILEDQSTPQTIGSTGARLGMLWVTDITVTNPIAGSVTGNAAAATNLLGGAGGTIPYQSALNTTQMLANGTVRQVLTSSGGTSAPTWKDLDARVVVTDADYVVTGTTNKTIAFASISTKRTVTLPAASTQDQIIRIVDESGDVSPVNRIKVIAAGADTIRGDAYDLQLSSYTNVQYKSSGDGKWLTIGKHDRLSTGIVIEPTFADNGGGSITIGNGGLYNIYKDATGLGNIKTYEIAGNTFALADLTLSYVVADYNSGTPIVKVITDVSLINETTIIPIYTIFRDGEALHRNEWDNLGLALVNKLHQSIVKTQRFRLESGLAIGESTGRRVTVGSGIVWTGAVKTTLNSFTSATDNLYYMYHVGGVWQAPSLVSVYNNSQYDTGTAVASLNPNKYAVNYIYRSVDVTKECYLVLGKGDYSLLEAQGSLPPTDIPSRITSHCILVGRIIVKNGDVTATQIDSIFSAAFALSTSVAHNDLSGLQGGSTLERYHMTAAQATVATQAATSTVPGYLTAADWSTFNNKVYLHGVDTRPVGANNPLPANLTTPLFTLGTLANPLNYYYIGTLVPVAVNKTVILNDGTGPSATSGVLVVGNHYKITTYVAGDNFTNVATGLEGTTNTTGFTFTATGTTPTTWSNGSTVQRVGMPGIYYIYFNGSTGNILQGGHPGISSTSNVILASVTWNGTDYGLINDERHNASRNTAWHQWAHDTIGVRYQSGITLTASGTGATATLATTLGEIHDEDIDFVVNAGTTCRHFWQTGATTFAFDKVASARPFKYGANNRPVYANSSSSYALTELPSANNRFLNFFYYVTTDLSCPIYMFVETATSAAVLNGYTSLANARAIPFPNLTGLGISVELKPIYRLIVDGAGLVQTITAADDYRTVSSLPQAAGTVSTTAASVTFTPYSTTASGNIQNAIEELTDEKVNVTNPTATVAEYADNTAASGAGLGVGRLYRTGDTLKIVHA